MVATLFEGEEADGDSVELQFNGDIQTSDLEGPLEGSEIADLVDLMSNGSAYVNVHTEIYPDGAIRGQITTTSGSAETGTNANATTRLGVQSTDSPDMDIDESLR
ncbi:MAG: CHRD domain-containing protein [Thermoproteota archaeon]|nr:CHRD domain-containing protein [Thermoproteota archaeon]